MRPIVLFLALLVAAAGTASADPTNDVKNAMIAFAKLTSCHATLEAQGRTIEADFVAPDRMHVSAGPMEMIRIGGTMYVNAGGRWMTINAPGAAAMLVPIDNVRELSAHPDNVKVTDLGPKTIAGVAYHAYRVESAGNTKPVTIYVDGSGAFARAETPGERGVSAIVFSKFNAPLKIEAPQ